MVSKTTTSVELPDRCGMLHALRQTRGKGCARRFATASIRRFEAADTLESVGEWLREHLSASQSRYIKKRMAIAQHTIYGNYFLDLRKVVVSIFLHASNRCVGTKRERLKDFPYSAGHDCRIIAHGAQASGWFLGEYREYLIFVILTHKIQYAWAKKCWSLSFSMFVDSSRWFFTECRVRIAKISSTNK